MAAPKSLVSPDKELRFTRAAQGRMYLVLASLLLVMAVGLVLLATQGTEFEPPRLQGYAWTAALPLVASWVMFRLAVRCIRHAYLIFTPLGLEIFPLFRPAKTMLLLLWNEIDSVECDDRLRQLSIHFNGEKSSGVIVSLAPILPAQRELLRTLVNSITEKRGSLGANNL